MKEIFKGMAPKTLIEKKAIWNIAIIIFDANVLLNLYRYSDSTRNELVDKISKLKNRIWLPYQAAYEFHKNRVEAIKGQCLKYDELILKFEELEDLLNSTKNHPFLSENLMRKLGNIKKEIQTESHSNKDTITNFINNDTIYETVNEIFTGKIGVAFTAEQIHSIETEGAHRYTKKIPPGFKDNAKTENKYGDLILWNEVLKFSKDKNLPIILVTNDSKEDWWWTVNGEKRGARPELVDEIWNHSQVEYIQLLPEQFLKQASDYLQDEVNIEAIEEIKKSENNNRYYIEYDNDSIIPLDELIAETFKYSNIKWHFPKTNKIEKEDEKQNLKSNRMMSRLALREVKKLLDLETDEEKIVFYLEKTQELRARVNYYTSLIHGLNQNN